MRYPRLPEELDLRKKLTAEDIVDIQQAYEDAAPFPSRSEVMKRRHLGLDTQSESQWIKEIMEMYDISYHTVYYWTHDEYRAAKMLKNAKAHSKADMKDYEDHRAKEIIGRAKRRKINSALVDYMAVQAAMHEKRSKRHSYKGIPLKEWMAC